VIALFDRAEARDFADVHALTARYSTTHLLDLAAAVDHGFDRTVSAAMLDSLTRFRDDEIPVLSHDVAELRAFFARWSRQLRDAQQPD